ncbi:MAG: hypothetical protein ACYC3L_01145 [Gemmatimonadaceae bacterium]
MSENPHLQSKRRYVNPVQIAQNWFKQPCPDFVTYDPNVQPDFWITRRMTHDGTLMFSMEIASDVIAPIYQRAVGFDNPMRNTRYVIGDARVAVAYGRYKLRCGVFPAQMESWTLPVRIVMEEIAA